MHTKFLAVGLVIMIFLAACSDKQSNELSKLQAEVIALKNELETIKGERDDLKFGSTRMLAEIEASATKANWNEVKNQAEALLERHPSAAESTKAKELLAKAEASLTQAARQIAQAEAKRIAEERQKKLKEERRLATALTKMQKKIDQVENITWYRDKTSPRYSNYNGFFIYIGKRQSGDPWLRFRVQYSADDWLFIESFLVVADDRRFEYNSVNFEHDNSSEIWEWYDESADSSDLEMIRAVIDSKKAVIRFNGRQYRRDRTITAAEKTALRNVLDAYKVLGGS